MTPHPIVRAAISAAALATVRSAAWVSPAVRSRYAAAPTAARLTSTTPPLSRATAHVLLEGIDFEADAEAVSAWVLDQTKECPEDVQVPLQAASKLNKGVAYVAVDDDAALLAASGREMLGRWIRAAAMQPLEKVVWLKVKGLPYETKREDLEAALGAAPRGAAAEGPIREVRWSLTAEGMPTGTAFVRFDTPREAAAARERDGTQLGGRWLDVQLYVETIETWPDNIRRDAQWAEGDPKRVMVRGLPFTTTSKELAEWLTTRGLPTDSASVDMPPLVAKGRVVHGRNKGIAYAVFADAADAAKALLLSGEEIGGRWLKIVPAPFDLDLKRGTLKRPDARESPLPDEFQCMVSRIPPSMGALELEALLGEKLGESGAAAISRVELLENGRKAVVVLGTAAGKTDLLALDGLNRLIIDDAFSAAAVAEDKGVMGIEDL